MGLTYFISWLLDNLVSVMNHINHAMVDVNYYKVMFNCQQNIDFKNQTCNGNKELYIEGRIQSQADIQQHCSLWNNISNVKLCTLPYSSSIDDLELECRCYLVKHGKFQQFCDTKKDYVIQLIVGISLWLLSIMALSVLCTLMRLLIDKHCCNRAELSPRAAAPSARTTNMAARSGDRFRLNDYQRNQESTTEMLTTILSSSPRRPGLSTVILEGDQPLTPVLISTQSDSAITRLPTYENVTKLPPTYETALQLEQNV